MQLKVNTTYHEFNDLFLNAIDNDSLEEFNIEIKSLLENYKYHLVAWRFLARVEERLGNMENALHAHLKVINYFDSKKAGPGGIKVIDEIKSFANKTNNKNLLDKISSKTNEYKTLIKFDKTLSKPKSIHFNRYTQTIADSLKPGQKFDILQNIEKNTQSESHVLDTGQALVKKGLYLDAYNALKKFEQNNDVSIEYYLKMTRYARAIKDKNISYRNVMYSVEKGLSIEGLTNSNLYYFYIEKITALLYKGNDKDKIFETAGFLYEYAESNQQKIVSIVILAAHQLSESEYVEALDWVNEGLELDPHNKKLVDLRNRINHKIADKPIEDQRQVGQGDIQIDLRVFSGIVESKISPLTLHAIKTHEYRDKEVLRKGKIATLNDANRLLQYADGEIQRYFNKGISNEYITSLYTDASKAYYENINDNKLKEFLAHRTFSNFLLFKGNEYYNDIIKHVLSRNKDEDYINIFNYLSASALSYYRESFKNNFYNIKLTENVLDNYLRILLIDNKLKANEEINKKSIMFTIIEYENEFSEHYGSLLSKCILDLSVNRSNLEDIINPNSKYFRGDFFKILNKYSTQVIEIINSDNEIDTELSFSEKIHAYIVNYENNTSKLAKLLSNEIRSQDWIIDEHILSELEINFEKITKFKHIISIPEEILIEKIYNLISRMKIESTKEYSIKQNAYDWVKSALLEIKQIINDNPTFLSIDSILPIIDKWLLSTSRRIHSRISAILPKLRANLNPETILLNDNIGVINVEIENLGADIGEDVSCEISIKDLDSNQIYNNNNNDIGNINQNSNFTWNLEIERDLLIPHLDKELLFSIQPNCKFRGDSVQCPEFIGSIAIRESINLSEEDIIWDETQTDVPENLFKGREGLLNELKYHYKSTNRNRTKVLYGMSRHGKTSLQNYLANILKDEEISIDSKKKTIFPIYWDFSTATGQEKSNDFWHNLLIGGEDLQQTRINGIIEAFKSYYPDLYNKSVQIKNIHMKSSIRFKHFIEIITEINDLGLYPLIVIDEFETIKSVMPDNEKDKNAILSWERLHVFRQMSLKNQASFIFAGQHESLDIIESGYRASFTNCDPIHVGVIDRQSATEIITAQPKIEFNKEAINAILIGSNNLPWAIQLICRRCGIYAVQNQRDLIGPNEVEHIIKILCGEIESDTLGIGKLEAQLASVVYRKNEYIHNAILTIFAHKTHSFEDWIEESEFETIWSEHFTKYTNHSRMTKRKQNALDQLIQRKVIQEESSDGIYKYKISMELFRRLWKVKNPHMKRYLDKILDADEQYSKEVYSL